MIEHISSNTPQFLILGGVTWLACWFAVVMFFFTCTTSIPVVRRIRAEGGDAPTVTNLCMSFGFLCLFLGFIGGIGFYVSLVALFVLKTGLQPDSFSEVWNNLDVLHTDLVWRHYAMLAFVILYLLWCFPAGYHCGLKNTKAAQC